MSKKVLKLAGWRPMLLALFIMATLTVSLLFSGWLTPTPSRAQGTGGPNPPPSNENTNCASTNCIEGGIFLGVLPIIPKTNCVFNGVSASANPIVSNGWYVVTTGCTNTLTNYIPAYPIIISDSNRWEVSGVGVTIPSGIGLVAGFTPTNCGDGTVTFYSAWQDACGTNLHDVIVSTNFYARCPTMTIGTVTGSADSSFTGGYFTYCYDCGLGWLWSESVSSNDGCGNGDLITTTKPTSMSNGCVTDRIGFDQSPAIILANCGCGDSCIDKRNQTIYLTPPGATSPMCFYTNIDTVAIYQIGSNRGVVATVNGGAANCGCGSYSATTPVINW